MSQTVLSLVDFPAAMIKSSDRRDLREKEFVLAYIPMIQSMMKVKATGA